MISICRSLPWTLPFNILFLSSVRCPVLKMFKRKRDPEAQVSWSIGGAPHTGIGGSHGNYESDSSPLKGDLYQYGNLGKLVISQYKEVSG